MAKITKVVGARFEDKDPILESFESVMQDHGLNQSTLTKLVFRYALIENPDSFRDWIAEKTIIVK